MRSINYNSLEVVRQAESKLGKFNKANLIEICPILGKTAVEISIKKTEDGGVLMKHGKDHAAVLSQSRIAGLAPWTAFCPGSFFCSGLLTVTLCHKLKNGRIAAMKR